MASVLGWLPQSAGLGLACAGWPGSNGSTMAANGGTVVAAGAEGLPDADVVAGLVLGEDEELPLLPQPAAVKPIRAANTAARATYRPIHATSAIPPMLAMIVAGRRLADDSAQPRYERTVFSRREGHEPGIANSFPGQHKQFDN
jgi:hypothetical protein